MIYPNLAGEIAKAGLSRKRMAEQLGVSHRTFYNWLSGSTVLRYDDAVKIKETFFPESTVEFLFQKKSIESRFQRKESQ